MPDAVVIAIIAIVCGLYVLVTGKFKNWLKMMAIDEKRQQWLANTKNRWRQLTNRQ